jgi:predicted alpha/beta hydrolase
VIQQWRRWCLHQDYAVGIEGDSVRAKYAAVTVPITSYSFSDDEFMSVNNINSLHCFYTESARDMKRIRPADVGVTRIGHFGFFRETYQDTLWHKVLHELT